MYRHFTLLFAALCISSALPHLATAATASPNPSLALGRVPEWCDRQIGWADQETFAGITNWYLTATFDYDPASATFIVQSSLWQSPPATFSVLHSILSDPPIAYQCANTDPLALNTFLLFTFWDPIYGMKQTGIIKPPIIPWPEAAEQDLLNLAIW